MRHRDSWVSGLRVCPECHGTRGRYHEPQRFTDIDDGWYPCRRCTALGVVLDELLTERFGHTHPEFHNDYVTDESSDDPGTRS